MLLQPLPMHAGAELARAQSLSALGVAAGTTWRSTASMHRQSGERAATFNRVLLQMGQVITENVTQQGRVAL